jgi:hypothetical protein
MKSQLTLNQNNSGRVYTLIEPIKTRVNGEDEYITELTIPEFITVGDFRNIGFGKNTQTVNAFNVLLAATKLKKNDADQLHFADLTGYSEKITELSLLDFKEECSEELINIIDNIKPVMVLVRKITAEMSDIIDFSCQVLELNGLNKDELNAIDIREFMPAAQRVIEVFTRSKR